MLFVVATPIGHLEDISKRALDTLASVDAILCEDTRRSQILLDRYGIKKPLIPYHKFTEKRRLEQALEDLKQGRHLALISDAGTPCINDPGQILIQACIENQLPFTAIPGPCSLIQALVLAGFDTSRFQFVGFLDRNPEKELRQILGYPGVTATFESPERLLNTLKTIHAIDPNRNLAVARELTKTFEECLRGLPESLISHFQSHPPKGEITLVIDQGKLPIDLSLEELVQMLQDLHGLSLKEAIQQAAKLAHVPKRSIYKKYIH